MVTESWPDEKEPALRARLEKGWAWLLEHCHEDCPRPSKHCDAFFQRFLDALHEYKRRYGFEEGE